MSKPSYIPIFPDSYLRDTFRLTTEQHGLYFLLMMECWNSENCSLQDDEKELARIAGITPAKFRKIAGPVLEKWTRENGRIWQKRLRKEWLYVRKRTEKRKAAANARWSKNSAGSSDANALQMECTSTSTSTSEETYPSRTGLSVGETREAADFPATPFRVVEGGAK